MKKMNGAALTGFLMCMCAILFGIASNGGMESKIRSVIVTQMDEAA